MKCFSEELKRLHLIHYHTYPRTPKMNARVERFNKTIQYDFVNFRYQLLRDNIDEFNRQLMDWLIWYNTRRVHCAFQNKLSPVQFMISLEKSKPVKNASESRIGCGYTIIEPLDVVEDGGLRYSPTTDKFDSDDTLLMTGEITEDCAWDDVTEGENYEVIYKGCVPWIEIRKLELINK